MAAAAYCGGGVFEAWLSVVTGVEAFQGGEDIDDGQDVNAPPSGQGSFGMG
jgi:hypothetical protein